MYGAICFFNMLTSANKSVMPDFFFESATKARNAKNGGKQVLCANCSPNHYSFFIVCFIVRRNPLKDI